MMFSANPRRLTALIAAPVAAAVVLTAATVAAPAAHARQQGAAPTPAQRKAQEAQIKAQQAASLKRDFGFSDSQVTKFQAKQDVLSKGFQGRIAGLRKKYGEKPTAAQQQAAMKELQPAAMQYVKSLEAALLSVATPAQQPRIKAKIAEARKQMQGGAGAGRPAPGR